MTSFVQDQAKAWREIPLLADPEATTVNGPGCTMEMTEALRNELPDLLRRHNIKSVLDIGCGDWTWMRETDLSMLDFYIGWDVSPTQIEENQRLFENDQSEHAGSESSIRPAELHFECQNAVTAMAIPRVDLIITRQFLIHFPNVYIAGILDKLKASGSTYLLASDWQGTENKEYEADGFAYRGYIERTTNLQAAPFNFPAPIEGIVEPALPGSTECVLKDPHRMALYKLPPRTFHSRAYKAADLVDGGFSVLGTVTKWNEGLEKMYGFAAPAKPKRVDGQINKDKLRRLRDNHAEVIKTIGDDQSPAAIWMLLGAHAMVIDQLLDELIGD